MHLARFPRISLGTLPTPLEPMPNLSKLLGGPNLFIKRDDCTGLASGGNKTRKLEFLMADALAQGADTVVTQGAVQTNHGRQTAAAAAKLGLQCEILLERRVAEPEPGYEIQGNVLFDRLLGAKLSFHPPGDMNALGRQHTEQLCQSGRKAYFIPGGGSTPIGALGYVNAALELLQQANDSGLRIDWLVHATGSAGTQAGLLVGLEGANTGIPVYGISVRQPQQKQEEAVHQLAQATAEYVGLKTGIARDRVVANADYVGGGYGVPTPEMAEAVALTARTEGILLDPVYSGKGMAGLIGLIRSGFFGKNDNVVFLHTGGSAALFAYPNLFSQV
ncbi:MAG: D-cysteine desulfhydrase [Candidatus Competibacteraceae bacterium]|nr:D-cysteine desulfhydrase [Candidatus Competibacteraceae bacterium]MCB1808766.1 D-cysteine desulfhydrase [Candidatus Competibacteraceae bacterium]MCB1815810.1 D-cysteine desulfhydrase [Candidatus Competibacteraceae bacterium]